MKLRFLLAMLALGVSGLRADDAPASKETIREMLEVTEARKLVEGMFGQMDGIFRNSVKQAMRGKKPSADEQNIIDRTSEKMIALIREELSWEKLEPMYFEIYQKSLTQEEAEGMVAFYKTKAGKAVIRKLPRVMQEVTSSMQPMMMGMMAKMQKISQGAVEEIKALAPTAPDGTAPAAGKN